MRFSELKDLLLSRGYSSGMVDHAIEKARKITRPEALKKFSSPNPTGDQYLWRHQ